MWRVFSRVRYTMLSIGVALCVYALLAWIPLRGLLSTILLDPAGPLYPNVIDAGQLLYASLFDFSLTDILYSILFSLLIGINMAMLIFYYRLSAALPSKSTQAAGIAGILTGVLGFGCATCGSLFASALLTSVAGSGFAARFALNGLVFQLLGVILIAFSILQLSRAINEPLVCPV